MYMGIFFLCASLFLRFYSPKERGNMFGYKSPQQGMRRNVWFWSNKCFGKLALTGSTVYLASDVFLLFTGNMERLERLNRYILPWILFSIAVTEIYTYIRTRGRDDNKSAQERRHRQ